MDESGAGQRTGDVPVACSLTPADLTAQAGCWQRLAAQSMTERTETADGIRLWFRPGPGAEEELRALAAVETECCPWADWTVQASEGHLMLDVRSSGAGIAALQAMFTGLRPG
jgi:hypothetical protein